MGNPLLDIIAEVDQAILDKYQVHTYKNSLQQSSRIEISRLGLTPNDPVHTDTKQLDFVIFADFHHLCIDSR